MRQDQQAAQTFVIVAMALVTGTVAVGLHQHAGLAASVAATTAVAVYVILLTIHAFVWHEERAAGPVGKTRDNREHRHPFRDGDKPGPEASTRNAAHRVAASPTGGQLQRPAAREAVSPALPGASRLGPSLSVPAKPQTPSSPTIPKGVGSSASAAPERQPEPALPKGEPDFWSYRPAPKLDLPPFVTGRVGKSKTQARGEAAQRQPAAAAPPPLPASSKGPSEADVEVIQDAIKRLLEEVNATEAQSARTRIAEAGGLTNAANAAPATTPSEQVDHSADALKVAAEAMRAAGKKAEAMPPPVPNGGELTRSDFVAYEAPQQAWKGRAIAPSAARAQILTEAINAGRIDVRLEPILGLEDHQTRHYEVSVRLRDVDGNPLEVDGTGLDLKGTGLLPLFDRVRVTRTAAVARRLEERGKSGSIFSRFCGESVADESFLGDLAEVLHQRASLAAQLVLSFSQSDVRDFAAAEWDSLADMRALGFRFALSDVTDLDMDFEALAEQGFVFVKLDAEVFLEGLPAPNGAIPSSDVCRHLSKAGLTLVVEHIDNDDQLARIFGFGVLLGQGQLFGGPRPVRADITQSRTAAA